MILAAVFGVFGTFKEFSKDSSPEKSKRLTIAGILATTLVSVIIQDIEYRAAVAARRDSEIQATATADTLNGITAKTLQITTANSQIQSDQRETLRSTSLVKDKVQQSLKEQGQLLTAEGNAVSTLSGITDPLDPIGVYLSVSFDVANNPCLAPYLDRIYKIVASQLATGSGTLV